MSQPLLTRQAIVFCLIVCGLTWLSWPYVHWSLRAFGCVLCVSAFRILWAEYSFPHYPRTALQLRVMSNVLDLTGLRYFVRRQWPFTVESFLSRATQRTGLTDFGDEIDGFMERFTALVDSCSANSAFGREFSTIGHIGIREDFQRRLVQRLLIVETWKKHRAAIDAQQIDAPIVIAGLARTGTSVLSRLIAADPNCDPLLTYEARYSGLTTAQIEELKDPTKPDPRIALTRDELNKLRQMSSAELQSIHEFGAELHEECIPLLLNSFAVPGQILEFDVVLAAQLTDPQKMSGVYNFYKLQLQVLQWLRAVRYHALHPEVAVADVRPKRWLLKYPSHCAQFDQLIRIFPGVKIVWTQRTAREVIPSIASLLYHLLAIATRPGMRTPAVHGRRTLRWWAFLHHIANTKYAAAAAATAAGAAPHITKLNYADIMRDPIAIVKQIYNHFGLEWSDATGERMRLYLRENPKNKLGVHTYSAAQYALTDEQIDAAFERADDINARLTIDS